MVVYVLCMLLLIVLLRSIRWTWHFSFVVDVRVLIVAGRASKDVCVVGGACGGRRRVLGGVCRTSLSDWAVVFEMNKVETVCTGVSVFFNGNVCN